MYPRNIQEYVVNKIEKILKKRDARERKKEERIHYLENILKIKRVCYNSECGSCNNFIKVENCNYITSNHGHCNECYQVICKKCGEKLCNLCICIIERRDYFNFSFFY